MTVKKVVKAIVIVAAVILLVALIVTPPMVMGPMVNMHVKFSKVYSAEEFGLVSEKLTLQASDGLNIVAYEIYTPSPKAIVIFLSGIHNPSVTAFFGHARLLQEQGYASILVEMRAHGESEGNVISLGYKEYLDTQAAVDYIKSSARYSKVPIVVFGVSMGGATAINSIGQIPDIDALIGLSTYSSWEDVFSDNMISMGVPRFYVQMQKPFVKLYSTFKYGLGSFRLTPEHQIRLLGDRPALLAHSTGDSQIPYVNFTRIMKHAPSHVETWTRAGDLHFIMSDGAGFTNPEKDVEYAARILAFLGKHFGSR